MNRNRWLVVGGQAVGQLATVATLPLLTRVLDPAPMGLYQSAFAIGVILQPLASLRLEFLLPAIRTPRELARLVRLSTWSQIISGSVLLVVFLVLAIVGEHDAGYVAGMAAVIMLAYAWTAMDNALLVRDGALKRLAIRNLLAGLITALMQIAVALIAPNVFLLALSILLGRSIAILLTRPHRRATDEGTDQDEPLTWTFTRGIYAVLSGVVSSASMQGLTVYVSAAFGIAAAGSVGVAQRSASAPVGFLSQGLSQYAQSRIAEELRAGGGEAGREIFRQIRATAPVAILSAMALAVLGPFFSPLVFGPGWPEVGPIIAILAVPVGLQLLLSPVMPVFVMLGHERTLLVLQLGRLLLALTGAAVLHFWSDSLMLSIVGFAVGTALGYVLMFVVVWRLVRHGKVS